MFGTHVLLFVRHHNGVLFPIVEEIYSPDQLIKGESGRVDIKPYQSASSSSLSCHLMDPRVGLDDCPSLNPLGVTNSLYRVEAPYGWEGGYRGARGSGGMGEARGEVP